MNFIEEKIIEKANLANLKLRFPPENSGTLTLGHCKAIHLNFGLAEKYGRPCNLRFDDTNPLNESIEFTNSIIEDIKWLGYTPSETLFTSDYFPIIHDYAVLLINKGLAYVDDSSSEEIASMKGTLESPGINSPFRNRTVIENLDLFTRMRDGEFSEGSRTLRAKIDMSSPNMILRDPVIYRIINTPHHHVGDKWKIYPMYDFAHPISDYIERITDSLCTLEFEVHRPLYMWVLENLDLDGTLPEETEFARLNVDYSVMSKRKFKRLVEGGHVDGWDDPRLLTVAGLRRRGYTPTSIRNFCEKVGVTKRESMVSHLLLEECLREDLNKISDRIMCVMDPIKLTITNWSGGVEWVNIENNPEDALGGHRSVPLTGSIYIERDDFRENPDKKYHRLKIGGEVRLKGGYIIKAEEIVKVGEDIVEVRCVYDPSTKSGNPVDRKVKGTIHWVSADYAVPITIRDYDLLFSDPEPDRNDDDFLNYLNPNSLKVNNMALCEPSVDSVPIGGAVQMVRKGYYVRDRDIENRIVFNRSVSLKEGWHG